MNIIRRRMLVRGVVQGVGFRPFVWSLAQHNGLTGWVRNSNMGVEAELQGPAAAIEVVTALIRDRPPPLAQVQSISSQEIAIEPTDAPFRILESEQSDGQATFVSPDTATCAECLAELRNPADRRFGYPFINCTHCGPRFTIQKSVPYDRDQTTMEWFGMCDLCRKEYESPADRRFHAQANACYLCGPTIWYAKANLPTSMVCQSPGNAPGNSHSVAPSNSPGRSTASQVAAVIQAARADIASGLIVAIKGIGGFHLACDAKNSQAVERLRERKKRPFKPLAVMAADIATACHVVELSAAERNLLVSRQRPIVLARKRDGVGLTPGLAPHNPYLGVLLPYSPLHYLLLDQGDLWVMTSGNLADEPIAYDNEDAYERLSGIADAFLLHDRPIHTVCDDSVMRVSELGPIPIRRSRGYAPLPVPLQEPGPTILAVGAEIKNTVCLASGSQAFLGPHVGDMGNLATLQAWERSCDHLQSLYRSCPEIIVSDQHPGYSSTELARQLAERTHAPWLQVQHHHAHAASLIAEHELDSGQKIIACVLDGTGYGADGAIWGGELLLASASSYQRVAHLQYAPLPGGDQCILHPSRTALSYLYGFDLPWAPYLPSVQAHSQSQLNLLRTQLDRRFQTVSTSSLGRLFDAVASLIGVCHTIDYEGQAAIELEFLAESLSAAMASIEPYSFNWTDDSPSQLDLRPMLAAICKEVHKEVHKDVHEVPVALIALKFHMTIACAFAEKCQTIREANRSESSLDCVGLTGGVFQNALLLRLMHAALVAKGFRVLTHQVVPSNDGGLALGQALIARTVARR